MVKFTILDSGFNLKQDYKTVNQRDDLLVTFSIGSHHARCKMEKVVKIKDIKNDVFVDQDLERYLLYSRN